MNQGSFLAQLRDRRVIRAAIIYVALTWIVLQVADLLASAGIIPATYVRFLIVIAIAGFPLTVIVSWFVDSPWRNKKWLAVLGDITVILAISAAALLFAWQQWFTSFSRPVVAVLTIEATDTHESTRDLAQHFAGRFRAVLALRPEMHVMELSSSQHASLANRALADKVDALGVDYLLTGTLAQGSSGLRLSLQLYDASASLRWSNTFEDRLTDLLQLRNLALEELHAQLPLPEGIFAGSSRERMSCPYPNDEQVILAVARRNVEALATAEANGMVKLVLAKLALEEVADLPLPRQSVAQQIAMQILADVEALCPGLPDTDLLRLRHTRILQDGDVDVEALLARHPNSAYLLRELATRQLKDGEVDTGRAYAREAFLVDPATNGFLCEFPELLESLEETPQAQTFSLPACN